MSRERNDDICERCRARAFEYRRGELDEEEHEQVRRHLEECEACRDYVERVDILVGAARDADPVEDPADADDLFDEIVADIESGESRNKGEVEGAGGARSKWMRNAAVAAAAMFAGMLLGLMLLQLWTSRTGPRVASSSDDAGIEESPEVGVERRVASGREAGTADASHSAFASLREVETDLEGAVPAPEDVDGESSGSSGRSKSVRLYASSDADWTLSEGDDLELELERGNVLVEFLPRGEQSLEVQAPGLSVRVVGTVFYVAADEQGARAGVLAGEVRVESSGRSMQLSEREEVTSDFERRPMPESRRRQLAAYVDPEQHRARLEQRSETDPPGRDGRSVREASPPSSADRTPKSRAEGRAPERESSAPEPSRTGGAKQRPGGKDAARSNVAGLRRRADRATARGAYDRALRLYRRFLDRAPSDHSGVPAVHLDVANLLVHRLDRKAAAVPHLRTFVERWPNDVAAASARKELCQITRELDGFEPECGADR